MCLPVSGVRGTTETGCFPCSEGVQAGDPAGEGTLQAASNARCLSVSSVVCTTVPAGPARVTAAIRDSSVLMVFQVSPVAPSATWVSSSASQQINTCARIRGSRRWNTGRSSSPDFTSRKPRSAVSRFCLLTGYSGPPGTAGRASAAVGVVDFAA